ncbi:hypothetical protein MMC25_003214 [Agyrium rufum]|nr:hypothetical protein [Agyrium rufum]
MHHIVRKEKPLASLRRKRSESSLVTTTSVTGTDQKARELKSAPYRNPRYELQLETLGIYIRKDGEDITDGSKLLCQKLLKTKQTLPQGTLFEDKLFKATWAAVQNRNECRVIRDLAQLIVPSAENLAIRGAKHLEGLIETLNEGWSNSVPILGPRPQPDYGVGFKRTSFNKDQLLLLEPFVGNYDHLSLFAATYDMFLPFLTAEVKCGTGELEVADRQNAHSMAVGLTGLVELFRLVGREKELHGEVNYFSISHNDHFVTIYGHYAMINGMETTFHRCKIYSFDFTALDGKEKWSAYTFVKNIYDLWVPAHFERICAVIDRLPNKQQVEDTIAMELQALNTTGLSQPLELHDLEVSNSQSGQDDLQTITPNTSIQPESSASSKKKAKSGKAATSKKKGKSGKSTSSKKQGKQTRRV